MRAAELWESAGVQEEAAPAENEAETSEETVLSENEAETSEEAVLSENEAGTSEEAVLSENEAMIPEETVATGYETETQDEMITSEEEAVTEDTVGAGDTESFTLKTTKLVHVGVGHAVSDLGTSDIEKTTYSLRLDSDTSIYTYFKPVSGYTGSFSAKAYKGDVKVSCKVKKQSDGRYRVIIPSIPAYNLSDSYTIKATTDNGTATYTVSPYTYANDLMTKYPEDPIVIKAMVSLYYYAQKAWTCKYGIGVN